MTYRRFTLREYDYILPDNGAATGKSARRSCVRVPRSAFDHLDRVLARDEAQEYADDHAFFLKRTSWHGRQAFQVQNHVGVLQTRCGTQIEILPKAGGSEEETRRMLVATLRRLRNSPFRLGGDALLRRAPMHLMEVFIGYFLGQVNQIVKRGLRSEYVTREENRHVLKGKLLVGRHVRVNAVQQQRFYCAHDEFLPDRAENRLIHRALHRVMRLSHAEENQRLCRELLFIFQDVPPSRDVARDLRLCRFNRATVHYRCAVEWARMILEGESSVPSPGKTETISILFPMEQVFEDYVGWMLARSGVTGLRLQASGRWLLEAPRRFGMRPDFLFWVCGGPAVGDAKWKRIDPEANDIECRVSQADLYQLYAYGKKYGVCQLFLFYPRTESFCGPIDWRFDDTLSLRLVPVPLPVIHGSLQTISESFARMVCPGTWHRRSAGA